MDAFFLLASEVAIRLLHIRKEFLWFCGVWFHSAFWILIHGHRFGCQVHQLRKGSWDPANHLSVLRKRKLFCFAQLQVHVHESWCSMETNSHRKKYPLCPCKEIFGFDKRCLWVCSLHCKCPAWGKTVTPQFSLLSRWHFSPLHIYLWPQNKQSLNFAKAWTEHNWRRSLTRGDAAHSLRSWGPCTHPPGCSHQTSPILFLLDWSAAG